VDLKLGRAIRRQPVRDILGGVSLDPGLLFLSLITSGIGFVLFVYGKKQERMPQLLGGIVMMVYPYFVSTLALNLLVGAGIVAAVWIAVRQGY
jgi:hypothetical protein